jgi:hypothetical protein
MRAQRTNRKRPTVIDLSVVGLTWRYAMFQATTGTSQDAASRDDESPLGGAAPGPGRLAVRRSLGAVGGEAALWWGALSCMLLLIGGFGPQADASVSLNLGAIASGTITTAYVVSGTIYVILALIAGVGLAIHYTQPRGGVWTLKLGACAGLAAMTCALFTFVQISLPSQVLGVRAGWGLYLVMVASLSLVGATGTLLRRRRREVA